MANYELNKTRIAELGIPEYVHSPEVEVLRGLPEIAAYLGCSVASVRHRIKFMGLPAISMGRGDPYNTTKTMIRSWIREAHLRRGISMGWIPDPDRPDPDKTVNPKK